MARAKLPWRRILLVAGLVAAALTLAGCNTVKGFGKDLQNAGEAIQHAAD